MSHLSIETLARLIDEAATSTESAHLERCDECRGELEGLKADAAALAALPELEPPSAQWFAVERQLKAEGLLSRASRRTYPAWSRAALQVAAAITLFVIGNITAPFFFGTDTRVARDAADEPGASVSTAAGPSALVSTLPGTRAEAADFVRDTERSYLNALTHYAELAGGTEPADPVARLAALESIVLTTRAALGQAPADPVINGYHLTALAQRDATLKRLAAARGQTWF
jgi:hypothetical protein